jgi:prepilin-type N-terminal cleavage/methylation domain-containing protein
MFVEKNERSIVWSMTKFDNKKGFTLVELIVVIAIIAILAAVSIVGFSSYIDSARFSNDTQLAAQMTTTLKNHLVLNPEEGLDSYQVREILLDYDDSIDFTPSASDTGFFYLAESDKIIAAKFEEAEALIAAELHGLKETVLLSDETLDAGDYASPEEIFGTGSHLLTTEDTPVAMVVQFVATMANSGSRIAADYDEALAAIADFQSNLFTRLFGRSLPEELEAKVTDFIQSFDPATTLYVNNASWATEAAAGSAIVSVVTTPGLSNIPAFNVTLSDAVTATLEFPSTVRTAEEGAMPDAVFTGATVTFAGDPDIKLPAGVLAADVFGDAVGVPSSAISSQPLVLIGYDGMISVYNSTIDMNELKTYLETTGIVVTGYRINMDLENLRNTVVYVYTAEGLVGYATPKVEVVREAPEA